MASKNIENTSAHKWAQTQQEKYLCACGCREYLKIKWHHKYEGIPTYINGHGNQRVVYLGNGKTRVLWGGRFPQKGKSKSIYYYARLSGHRTRHCNLGSDLNLAKKFVYAYEKAYHNTLHWHSMLRFIESVTFRIKKQNTTLQNVKIDRSLMEAKKALIQLRKTIKSKSEEAK